MHYTITMVTFENALKTEEYFQTDNNAKHRPRLEQGGFSTANVSSFQIEDDDPGLNFIVPGRVGLEPEDGQKLVHDLSYGAGGAQGVLPAGTQISAYHSTIIQDEEGNRFYYMFLWKPGGTNQNPVLIGGGHSAILLPIAHENDEGETIWPQFNPSLSFNRVGSYGVGTSNPSLPLDPAGAGHPPCFTPGTLIDTAKGLTLIEQLRVGDLICTRDHGLQPIRWIGATFVTSRRLDLQPNLRPILIPAQALGPDTPKRDLTVSPQHRMLIQSRIAMRMFDHGEVLVAARHLLGLNGITAQAPAAGVTYLHVLFDQHEVIRSNGAWSESFLIGPQMIKSGDRGIMAEITSLFPELLSLTPARRVLSGHESRKLTLRHSKNNRELVLPVS